MVQIVSRLSSFLCLYLSIIAVARTQPLTYGTNEFVSRNCRFTVQVSGYAGPDEKVSGTNEGFSIRVSVTKNEPYVGEHPWTHGQLLQVHLTIGGEVVHLKNWTIGATDAVESYAKNVRFATTYFSDNASKFIWLTGTFRVWRLGSSVPPDPPPILESSEVSLEPVSIPVKIYNKAKLLATQVVIGGGTPPANNPLVEVAQEITNQGRGSFAFAKHTVSPATGENNLSKSEIISNLYPATVFLACTHGSPSSFNDSTHWDSASIGSINWSEVTQALLAKLPDSLPRFNLVLMYSCATLPASSQDPAVAFQVTGTDRAYAGFSRVISCAYFLNLEDFDNGYATYRTDDHAVEVLNALRSGFTLQEALQFANLRYPQYTWPILDQVSDSMKEPMTFLGDPLTRLQLVYLTDLERANATEGEINSWFFVYDLAN